jgi:TetR/AcrR family transcriptional regulator
MGIPERRLREKEERREFILLKAKELILNYGVNSLNMQQIADGVELSKATLYLYFQNKEALLTAILNESATTFIDYVHARILPSSTGLEAIHALWASYLAFFGESEDLFLLTGINSYVDSGLPMKLGEGGAARDEPLQTIVDLIAELLTRGVSDGSLDPSIDPQRAAGIVIMAATSIIDRIGRLPRADRNSLGTQVLLRNTFEILLRGLASRDADPALLSLPDAEKRKEKP